MYAVLCDYAAYYKSDHCYPTHATLAERLSCSVSSVKNYLAELVGAKLITIQRKHNSSSRYYMLRPAALDKAETVNHTPETAPEQPKVAYAQPKSGYINNLTNQEKEIPPLPPIAVSRSVPPASRPVRDGGAFFHDFEKVCAAYPKKEALGLARSAWQWVRRSGLLPSLDVLLAAIEKFKATQKWQRENGRFIPQLSIWLRGLCWQDSLSGEEEEAARLRQEAEKTVLAFKREEETREAKRKAERERLRPVYEAFRAKFPAENRNEGMEAMHFGKWLHLHGKYAGPTAADVPENNTKNMADFMTGYPQRREASAYHAGRAVLSVPERQGQGDFLSLMFPASPLCAAV